MEEEREYFYRLIRLVVDVGTEVLLKVFKTKAKPSIQIFLKSKESKIKELKKRNNQLEILNQTNFDETKLDISLLYTLLRNLTDIQEPTNGWNACPLRYDMSPGACLTRLKNVRNEAIAHRTKVSLVKSDFDKFWEEASKSLVELAGEIGSDEKSEVQQKVDDCKTQPLLGGDIEKPKLDALLKWDLEESYSKLKSEVDILTDKVEKQGSRCENSEKDNGENKKKIEGLERVITELKKEIEGLIGVEFKRQMKENLEEIMLNLRTVMSEELHPPPEEFRITNPNALGPKEIIKFSKEIGPDWKFFAGYLGFTSGQIDTLAKTHGDKHEIICKKMLQKWHEVVARSNENPKKLLAAAFLQHDDHHTPKIILGNELNEDEVKKCKRTEETTERIQDINFEEQGQRPIHIDVTLNHGAQNALNQFGGHFENKGNASFST